MLGGWLRSGSASAPVENLSHGSALTLGGLDDFLPNLSFAHSFIHSILTKCLNPKVLKNKDD